MTVFHAFGREGIVLVLENGDILLPAPGPQGIGGRAALNPEGEGVQSHAAAVIGAGRVAPRDLRETEATVLAVLYREAMTP